MLTYVLSYLTICLAVFSLIYVALGVLATLTWRRKTAATSTAASVPVTVLKPLCGLEPGLEANLRSFCAQDYPTVELLFGARDSDDPALALARRVAADYPHQHIRVVAGAHALGENRKVNILTHLMSLATHDTIVIADSDVRVGPSYLQRVVAPLADPTVGIVTCSYRGRPTEGLWSQLGALAIDEWFIPSVLVSQALGSNAYCSGTTMALRRDLLEAAGGFPALAPLLADDYELGARVRRLGLRCVVAQYEVAATAHEPTLLTLIHHELRWMRTIRTVTPVGHALSFLTYVVPLTLLAALVNGSKPWTLVLPALAILLRIALHYVVLRPARWDRDNIAAIIAGYRMPYLVWMVPMRDLMSFALWIASYTSRRVTWRGTELWVRPDGVLRTNEERIFA